MNIDWSTVAWETNLDSAEDAEAVWDALSEDFMAPVVQEMDDSDATDMGDEYQGPGWYGRLSANGYMDCTDWTGPFDSVEKAIAELINMYGDE